MAGTAIRLDPPGMTGCYVGYDGDEQARLYDCREYPIRGTARAAYAADIGERLTEIRVTVIYARWLTRQEQWDAIGRDRWGDSWVDRMIDEHGVKYVDGDWRLPDGRPLPEEAPEPPDDVPEGWEPWEDDPAWTSCKRTHPDAVRCWLAEWTG